MDIHAILEQLEFSFPEYVIKLDPVPEEEGLVSINVFGVPRADFHDVKEFIFDLEEEFSGEEIFIPICYTKQELQNHYPMIFEEYALKQRALRKQKEGVLLTSAFSSYGLAGCPCMQSVLVNAASIEMFASQVPTWKVSGNKEAVIPSLRASDESYAFAA